MAVFCVYVTVVTLCLLPLSMGQLTPGQVQSIHAYVRQVMQEDNIPGLALGIVYNGSITTAGYGYRDLENQLPVTPRTLFGLASVTKGFTSTLVTDYYLRNNLPLEAPIESYLPGQLILVDRYRSHHANMIDLLSHRLCVDPQIIWLYTGVFHTKDEVLRRFRYYGDVCPFRTDLTYHNVAYVQAGKLLEDLSGKTWEQLIADNIFSKVGMTDSTVSQVAWANFDSLNMAHIYSYNGTQFLPVDMRIWSNTVVTNPAGGIVTTAADMARWAYVLLSRGVTPEGERILDEEIFRLLFKPNQGLVYSMNGEPEEQLSEDFDMFYGLGFYVGVKDGYRRYSHAGTWGNFDTRLNLYPQLNLGIYTSTNGPSMNVYQSQSKIQDFIFYTVRGTEPPTAIKQSPKVSIKAEIPKWKKAQSPFVLAPEQFVGVYGNWSHGDMNVTLNSDGVLEFLYGDLGDGFLYPTEVDNVLQLVLNPRFDFLEAPPIYFEFLPSEDGTVMETAHLVSFIELWFIRNQTLDTAPEQLWDNINC